MLKFRNKKKVFFPKFSLVIWLLTLVAAILALVYQDSDQLNARFAINPSLMAEQLNQSWLQIYRLFSSLFLHGSWLHWSGNMLVFLIIALPLEKKIAGFWFLLIYFSAGIIANIVSLYQLGNSEHFLLGASGAVSGLLGAWLLLFPKLKIRIIIPIGLYLQKARIPIVLIALIWLSLQIILQLTSHQDYPVVWMSHIVGFITGFFVAWLYRIFS